MAPARAPLDPVNLHVRLGAMYFAYFAYVGAYAPYLSLYFQSIGQSAQAIGLLLGAMQCVRIFAPNFWAGLADRSGQRVRLLRIALALSVITFAGLFFTVSTGGIALMLVLHAFCAGGVNPLVETITLSSLRERIARYGPIRLWGSIGFIAAVMGTGWQLDYWSPASVLVTTTALLLLSCVAAWSLPAAASPTSTAYRPIGELIRRREVVTLFAACLLMTVAHGPLYSFYTIFLVDYGYAKSTIGMLWSLGVVAEIVVFWTMPRWLGPRATEVVFAVTFALAVLRFVLVGWFPESLLVQLSAQILHGATFGAHHVCAMALLGRSFDEATRARGQALYSSISFGAGGMSGAIGSGWLWSTVGPAWTFTAASAFALLALIVALCGLPGAIGRRTIRR